MKTFGRRTTLGSLAALGALSPAVLKVAPQGAEGGDPTPWASPGPYLGPAGFQGFEVVRAESFGARQRVAATYFFY